MPLQTLCEKIKGNFLASKSLPKEILDPQAFQNEAKKALCNALLLARSGTNDLDSFRKLLESLSFSHFTSSSYSSLALRLSYRIVGLTCQLKLDGVELPFIDGSAPSQVKSLEMGIMYLALGILERNEELLMRCAEIGDFLLQFLDENKEPLFGIWLQEEEYIYEDLILKYFILFQGLAKLSEKPIFLKAAEILQKKIEKFSQEENANFSSFAILFFEFFEKHLQDAPKIKQHSSKSEMTVTKRTIGDFSLALTTVGINTGLGSVKKGEICLQNFGPHFFPLDDAHNFGIFQMPLWEEKSEIKNQKPFHFKGWTSLISPVADSSSAYVDKFRRGSISMELTVLERSSAINLGVRFLGSLESSKVAFTFYIMAEKIAVDQNIFLHPRSLDRYQGSNQKIKIISTNDHCYLAPLFDGEMQIFPLAGKNHFWGAHFLVAYTVIDENKQHVWNISD